MIVSVTVMSENEDVNNNDHGVKIKKGYLS